MPHITLTRFFLLVLVGVSVFFTNLGGARLWDRDEPRNAGASHEMLARGDWVVPTFNGELRAHKPALLYWGQMAAYQWLGESEFAARLPSAVCGLLTMLATAILASRLTGTRRGISREGFWAATAVGTCTLLVMAGRAATPDGLLVALSTLGIAFLVIGSLHPSPPFSSGRVGSTRWLYAAGGYALLGLAVLAKGPIGFILPMGVVGLWWMICSRLQEREHASLSQRSSSGLASVGERVGELWRMLHPLRFFRAVWQLRILPGTLLMLLVAAPWYVAVGLATEGEFLRGFFWEHNVGRAVNSMEGHGGGPLFYPLAFLVGTFPWSLWLIPIVMWSRRAANESVVHRQLVVLGAVWIGIYITAFSIASTKLPSYITPCYAGAALLIGGYWRQFETAWSLPSLGWRRTAYALTLLLGVGISLAVSWLSQHEAMPQLMYIATAGISIAVLGLLAAIFDASGRISWVPGTWLAGGVAFQLILFGFGANIVDRHRTDLDMLIEVKQQLSEDTAWCVIGGMEPSWVYYLQHEIEEISAPPSETRAWDQVRAFFEQHPAGNLLVVGDLAHELLRVHESRLPPLQAFAHSPRFVQPGQITLFRGDPPSLLADAPAKPSESKPAKESRPMHDAVATSSAEKPGRSAGGSSNRANGIANPLRTAGGAAAEPLRAEPSKLNR